MIKKSLILIENLNSLKIIFHLIYNFDFFVDAIEIDTFFVNLPLLEPAILLLRIFPLAFPSPLVV